MTISARICITLPVLEGAVQQGDLAAPVENPANVPNPLAIIALKRYFWRPGRTL